VEGMRAPLALRLGSEVAPSAVMVDVSGEGAAINIESGGSDEFGAADAAAVSSGSAEAPRFTPAEPVVTNTGAFGTAAPPPSTMVGRAASSARALAGKRGACALLDDAFAAADVAAETDCEELDCDEVTRGDAACDARSAWSRKNQQRRLVPCSRR
jgi:hypothetical protein